MIEYEYYNWTSLIDDRARSFMKNDIDNLITSGQFWHNSPPYQTNVNVFGLNSEYWTNLKMSFIWSCFAFMRQDKPIKTIKSWGYKTNVDTQEDRDTYWHQHLRDGSVVLSGVFYLHLPDNETSNLFSGTELAYETPEGESEMCPSKLGHWIIFPGKTWHRPGILESKDWRYIVAADMEL